MKPGVVYYELPPIYNRNFSGDKEPKKLKECIARAGFDLEEYIVTSSADNEKTIEQFIYRGCQALIVCFHHWTRISLVTNLVRRLNVPTALYAVTGGGFNGTTALTAVSGSLKERSFSRFVNRHSRFKEGMEDALGRWLAAAGALQELRKSRVLMWGGPYGADMPYTRSDPDYFENVLIAEVMQEQEVVLTDTALSLISNNDPRIDEFIQWIKNKKVEVQYDNRMITSESLKKQAAIVLAAEDRLQELRGENIKGISLKCHFELSLKSFKCTGCLIPAFLPFGMGPNGKKAIIPVACEGDLNGLMSMVILSELNKDVPPLFGDFVDYGDEYVLMRNCGASSVFWNDPRAAGSLEGVQLLPNMHGKSGAAVHYETPEIESITLCRIARIDGKFCMSAGEGRVLSETEDTKYSDTWPHTRIQFKTNHTELFKFFPCNHASITIGNYIEPLRVLSDLCGMDFIDINK